MWLVSTENGQLFWFINDKSWYLSVFHHNDMGVFEYLQYVRRPLNIVIFRYVDRYI